MNKTETSSVLNALTVEMATNERAIAQLTAKNEGLRTVSEQLTHLLRDISTLEGPTLVEATKKKLGRPRKSDLGRAGVGAKNYWASMTQTQRSAEMTRRQQVAQLRKLTKRVA